MDVQNEAMDFLYNSLGKIVPDFTPKKRRLTLAYLDRNRVPKETDIIVWHSSATEDKAVVSALRMEAEEKGWMVTAIYEAGSSGRGYYLYYAPPISGGGYPRHTVGRVSTRTRLTRRGS